MAIATSDTLLTHLEYSPSSCPLHYSKKPLNIVRGQGQYLYDSDNICYLDCVNNHSHVGHCHSKIKQAALSLLPTMGWAVDNCSTINDPTSRYIQELRATFPPQLNTFFFTDSGSEAIDLAVQLSKAYTGHSDVVVVDGAFHGQHGSAVECCPHQWKKSKIVKKNWVHVLPLPDVYRGIHKDTESDAVAEYVADSQRIIQQAQNGGRKIAAFLTEPIFSMQGLIVPPEGWLAAITKIIREAGGLLVIDEVNTGFGRCGNHNYWSYQIHSNVVPDIVILGKPIGNGFPMGVVVTTDYIGKYMPPHLTHCKHMGNPFASAIGIAVLDVLKAENLLSAGTFVGQRLYKGLNELTKKHYCLGRIQGAGMMIGIEIVFDQQSRKPDPTLAERIAYRLKDEERMIVGLRGKFNSTILLIPPLCFTFQNAQQLIDALDRVLSRGPPEPEAIVSLASVSGGSQSHLADADEEYRISDMD